MGTSDFTVQTLFLLTQHPLRLLVTHLLHLLFPVEHQVCVASWGMGKLTLPPSMPQE